jgi:hypothetical protein
MSRKLRVRENPTSSFVGGVVAVVLFFFGLGKISEMGGFGVLWTLAALVAAIVSFYNAFSDEGVAKEIIEVPDDVRSDPAPAMSPASRLTQLKELRDQGLITADEYEERRAAIVSEL